MRPCTSNPCRPALLPTAHAPQARCDFKMLQECGCAAASQSWMESLSDTLGGVMASPGPPETLLLKAEAHQNGDHACPSG